MPVLAMSAMAAAQAFSSDYDQFKQKRSLLAQEATMPFLTLGLAPCSPDSLSLELKPPASQGSRIVDNSMEEAKSLIAALKRESSGLRLTPWGKEIDGRGLKRLQVGVDPVSEPMSDVVETPKQDGEFPPAGATNSKEISSGDDDDEADDVEGSSKKKLRLDKDQFAVLEEIFQKRQRLTPKHKAALAKQLNVRTRQVEVWFQNRRARTKVKQTEQDREALKAHCDSLMAENRRLQQLLQEMKSTKSASSAAPQLWPPQPATTTMVMCPSCQRVATVGSSAAVATQSAGPISAPTTIHFLRPKED